MQNFLQLLMDVVLLIAQKQAEEEEEEAESPEKDARDEMKQALAGESDAPSPEKEHEDSNNDETDTQKIANDMDLNDDQKLDSDQEHKSLDFYNGDEQEPKQMIDVEDEAMMLQEGSPQTEDDPMEHEEKFSEEKPQ